MHTAISYELAQTRIADLRRLARNERLARTAAHAPSSAPRRRLVPILAGRGLRSGRQRRAWQATSPAV
ncbi:MAG TPA: hypothetical protein VGS06_27735 [Streptosporangiaceae bacterium]|nr:hypothetical protein [Streptosporangiaceae bacterium]